MYIWKKPCICRTIIAVRKNESGAFKERAAQQLFSSDLPSFESQEGLVLTIPSCMEAAACSASLPGRVAFYFITRPSVAHPVKR